MSEPASAPPVEIDVFSDVVCPWCFIGLTRLERVLAARGLADTAVVRLRTFLLDPDAPDAGKDLHAELRRKYGRDPAPMFARVEAEAKKSGIPLDLSKQPHTYPTLRAHTLLRAAGARGTQRALGQALFAAYFLDGKAIADPDVLAPIAAAHGFTEAEARALIADAGEIATTRQEGELPRRLGIGGAPFFIFNGAIALSGAQPEDVLHQAFDEVKAGARPA